MNNSFAKTVQNKGGTPAQAYQDMEAPTAVNTSGGAIRSYASESVAPFTIKHGNKIPDITEYRRDDREERQATL